MGIVNATVDSFANGGRVRTPKHFRLISHSAVKMLLHPAFQRPRHPDDTQAPVPQNG
jgi:dihydropteroate synthase